MFYNPFLVSEMQKTILFNEGIIADRTVKKYGP
jgi:hypothetical protein